MEVDANGAQWDENELALGSDPLGLEGGMGSIFKDLMKSVPGIDEALAFGELMKMVV
jgi:hypothetical protein